VVEGAVDVLAEGGVGVLMFEGLSFGLLLVASFAALVRDGRRKGGVVKVPSRQQEVKPRWFSKLVGRVGLIGGSQVGGCASSEFALALFMLSREWVLWYSFIR
jgi:hypothetical protein